MNTAPAVRGFDISHHNGDVDFHKAAASGMKFCYVKATEYVTDPLFTKNRAGAKAAGIHAGFYHFWHYGKDWGAQASRFVKAVGKLQPGELPPVLDIEDQDYRNGKINVSNADGTRRILAWLHAVEAALGVTPFIYADPDFVHNFLQDVRLSVFPLWLAAYQSNPPQVPVPWPQVTVWQNAEFGSVEGIGNNDVDTDLWIGSKSLDNYVIKPHA